jgi:hypothetical protein
VNERVCSRSVSVKQPNRPCKSKSSFSLVSIDLRASVSEHGWHSMGYANTDPHTAVEVYVPILTQVISYRNGTFVLIAIAV